MYLAQCIEWIHQKLRRRWWGNISSHWFQSVKLHHKFYALHSFSAGVTLHIFGRGFPSGAQTSRPRDPCQQGICTQLITGGWWVHDNVSKCVSVYVQRCVCVCVRRRSVRLCVCVIAFPLRSCLMYSSLASSCWTLSHVHKYYVLMIIFRWTLPTKDWWKLSLSCALIIIIIIKTNIKRWGCTFWVYSLCTPTCIITHLCVCIQTEEKNDLA